MKVVRPQINVIEVVLGMTVTYTAVLPLREGTIRRLAGATGCSHVTIDGVLIEVERCRTPGPVPGVDLWRSAKHDQPRRQYPGHHRRRRLADLDLRRVARPRTPHDTTATRAAAEMLPALHIAAVDLRPLGDLDDEGESDTITLTFRKPCNGRPAATQQQSSM